MPRFQWLCDTCGKRIRDGEGYVCVDHVDAMEKRDTWAAWKQANAERMAEHETATTTAAEVPHMVYVPWQVLHAACDPRPDTDDYWIGVERIRDLAALLEWNAHLHGKVWLRYTDWDRFIQRRLAPS